MKVGKGLVPGEKDWKDAGGVEQEHFRCWTMQRKCADDIQDFQCLIEMERQCTVPWVEAGRGISSYLVRVEFGSEYPEEPRTDPGRPENIRSALFYYCCCC